ncbi:hypothetical protein E4U21_004640 [Claviceps maximensis]|nr:hypothetical protein E4U21_004640 [Claviceps maximensis]
MDMAKRRLGTPSNGSLQSTFTTYGSHLPSSSTGPRSQAAPAQRRPLRSISQNSSLPPSPGLLVSMLKTATEMGDVGTFPMQKQSVTPTAYHQHPRSRPDLVSATSSPKYTPKRNENYYYADDGRPFRSYRDTASEIISLYAYDSQPPYFGSGSPIRMIELDRVSHRTVHNSYKPNSLKWARRPPPLSIRPDYSRSAASLPLGASSNAYHRSRTPSSSHSSASRYGRFERHTRMPLDHEERSPSLSSIVGMYRPPSSAKNSRSQSQRACQFYYDYSEDFDNPTARESDVHQQPMAHTERYHGDGGVEGECEYSTNADGMANLNCAVEDERCAQKTHNEDKNVRSSSTTSAERGPLDGEHGGCNQADFRLREVRALRKLSRSAPPSSQQLKHATLREDREAQNELASLTGDSPRTKLLRVSKNLADQASDKISTRSNGDDAHCSPEQSIPDFASIFGSFDLLDRSPYFKSTSSFAKALDATGENRSIHSADHASHARHLHDLSSTDTNSSEERVDESGFSLSRSAQDKKLDILSPEPISPVRGLKVKNSIPQLMKALPPLPSRLSQYVQTAAENSASKDTKHAEQLDAEGCRDEDAMQDGPQKAQTRTTARASPSKFKVRVKPSTSQMRAPPTGITYGSNNQTHSGEIPQDVAARAQAEAKPKLKIKISRAQLGQGHYATGGALPRANRLKDCNSLAELAPCSSTPPKMADGSDVGGDSEKHDSQSDKRHGSFDGVDELPIQSTSTSPQPSDPFNIPYPSSSDDNATNSRSISSSNKDTLVPRLSCSPDTSLHHENGLRNKMSMFRLRLVESFSTNAMKKDEKAEELSRSESHISINMTSKASETNMTALGKPTSRCNKEKSDWMSNRVKRWAIDAKKAVRSYVRRTLERSPRRNE